jgi:hypothetical protein
MAMASLSNEVKYLGVHLDKRLTFESHISKSVEKASSAFKILYSFLNRKSKLCVANKLLLYKVCIRPILCYGVECWNGCAATHRRNIQIIQNKQLKIIMDRHSRHSTEALHEEAGVPLIEDFIQRIVETFFHKIVFFENPFILGLNDSYTVIHFLPKLCISFTDSQPAKFRKWFGMISTTSKLCIEIFT